MTEDFSPLHQCRQLLYFDEMEAKAKETVQTHAEAQGESLNGFINRAISETMERDSEK